jgi:predicted RNA-binding protein (virulence factor B family)
MIHLGETNQLKIVRQTHNGLQLTDEEASAEVLLPNKELPKNWKPGDTLQVFVFKDSDDCLLATRETPLIKLHEFACLQVKDVNEHGAFLDWGLDKDLFVPFREQPGRMIPGNWYIVYLYLDEQTNRLAATGRYQRFFQESFIRLEAGQEVDLLIDNRTELGHNVIINNRYQGLVYDNETFAPIRRGDRCKGYIKQVREDGKIDVSLEKPGYAKVEPNGEKILAALQANQGFLPLTDKSAPDEISRLLQMSKKTFKKAIGLLYKLRRIRLEADGIYLVA